MAHKARTPVVRLLQITVSNIVMSLCDVMVTWVSAQEISYEAVVVPLFATFILTGGYVGQQSFENFMFKETSDNYRLPYMVC